jgi:hypothetical protein
VTNSRITHNLIYNLTGRAVAIQPGASTEANNNNLIDGNLIHDVNTGSVNDDGAIIVSNLAHDTTGNVISNNYIYNYGYLSQHVGIYLDGQYSNALVTHNLVYGTGSFPLQIHGGDHLTMTGNWFDITLASDAMAVYQDMVSLGEPNYGMGSNAFNHNTVSVQCSASTPHDVWWSWDSTGGAIAWPAVTLNTYYNIPSFLVTAAPFTDTAPIYQSGCYTLPTSSAWSNAGPLPN